MQIAQSTNNGFLGSKAELVQDLPSVETFHKSPIMAARATQADSHRHLKLDPGTPHRTTNPSIIGGFYEPSDLSTLPLGPQTAVTGYSCPLSDVNINPQHTHRVSPMPDSFHDKMDETHFLPGFRQPMVHFDPPFLPVPIGWEDSYSTLLHGCSCTLLMADIAKVCWCSSVQSVRHRR
ncbi:hypothetical protein M409DRAFT_61633 [Zasmidium cellare ATCC 36951]|uniref:Uncharacterized protein n=1 Tax=Zasmidium cellare ATCC 36951 TaxID=1080233 RepID=A0A6A6BYJ1_ZASCE|nr:uncharacterized protein M409DRAFT_61633 [Zasmidium cellare ATCC 36951]KAF2158476.1 hypothetical protein M409DRAFT_61633 [Zasmidium cellare ATCC 36951]